MDGIVSLTATQLAVQVIPSSNNIDTLWLWPASNQRQRLVVVPNPQGIRYLILALRTAIYQFRPVDILQEVVLPEKRKPNILQDAAAAMAAVAEVIVQPWNGRLVDFLLPVDLELVAFQEVDDILLRHEEELFGPDDLLEVLVDEATGGVL